MILIPGGEPGARGYNFLVRADGRVINLGPKTAVQVFPGDMFSLHTPGGGGYGVPGEQTPEQPRKDLPGVFLERGSVFEYRQAQEGV
nr:unnamed protein product [Callosobruchus analis]